jgi:hypothetical protein
MKNPSWAAGSVSFAFRALLGGTLVLSLSQCGVEQGEAGENIGTVAQALEHCGGVACTGVIDCQTNIPLCAQATSATCLTGPPKECVWKLAISSSCPCMEHDVRLCTQTNGSPGVQICTANAPRTGTYWNTCIACPGCG